jgi:predicted RNase H-like HicB family nuclease
MKLVVTLERDEEGWVVVDGPALPGCCSQGRSVDEALETIREALRSSLETRASRVLPLALEDAEVEVRAPAR